MNLKDPVEDDDFDPGGWCGDVSCLAHTQVQPEAQYLVLLIRFECTIQVWKTAVLIGWEQLYQTSPMASNY